MKNNTNGDNKPLVSIIMSIYNGSQFLFDSVNSILNQTYTNFEFIIVDDGSTDSSYELIKKFSDNNNKVKVFKRAHYGLANSLNFAISKSKGEYIARMDADDISKEVRIEKQVKYLEKNKNVDLLGSNRKNFGNINKNNFSKLPTNNNIIKWHLFFSVPIIHPAIMVRADILKSQNGYSEEYKYAQDYELYTRLSKTSNFHNLSEALIEYRNHHCRDLTNYHKEQLNCVIKIRRDYIGRFLKRKISTKEVRLFTEFDRKQIISLYDLMDAVKIIKKIKIIFKSRYKINSFEESAVNEYIALKLLNSIKYQYHFGIMVILYLFFNSLLFNKGLLLKKLTWWNLKTATFNCIN